jgi:hypothetical protein
MSAIRRGLLIGLASFGEIERLQSAQDLRKICDKPIPEDLRVIHPTGRGDTVCELSEALLFLEMAEPSDDDAEAANG